MDSAKMVHMANQIAQFFAAYPRAQAVDGIADHLRKFWAPRMRRQLLECAADQGAGLHELVREAIKQGVA